MAHGRISVYPTVMGPAGTPTTTARPESSSCSSPLSINDLPPSVERQSAPRPTTDFKDTTALGYYRDHLRGAANPSPQNKSRGDIIVKAFQATATAEEKLTIRTVSDADQLTMAESFEDRVIGRLLHLYKEADPTAKVAKLQNFEDLSMNSIDYHCTQLAKVMKCSATIVKTRMLLELSQQEYSQFRQRPAHAARNKLKPAAKKARRNPTD